MDQARLTGLTLLNTYRNHYINIKEVIDLLDYCENMILYFYS